LQASRREGVLSAVGPDFSQECGSEQGALLRSVAKIRENCVSDNVLVEKCIDFVQWLPAQFFSDPEEQEL
jgi:hypothetical protein